MITTTNNKHNKLNKKYTYHFYTYKNHKQITKHNIYIYIYIYNKTYNNKQIHK